MDLTPGQKDALTELINIGYGRAAGALSELTGYRITLEVPQVSMHEMQAIAPMLEKVIKAPVASVDQAFSGPVSGTALLMLDQEAAVVLSQLLTEESPAPTTVLDLNGREIITEVGNILLNACLGVFGNLLEVQITFSVPRLQVDSIAGVLNSIQPEVDVSLHYALMIHTRFCLKTGSVAGYLVIILGISSLDRLLLELEKWEQRQAT